MKTLFKIELQAFGERNSEMKACQDFTPVQTVALSGSSEKALSFVNAPHHATVRRKE